MDEQTEIQIEALVRRARQISGEIKELQETKTAIESKIDSLVDVGWKADIDGVQATKRLGNRSFSVPLALARMTAEQKLECVTTNLNAKKVREWADSEGITEECMEEPSDKTRLVLS